jgi:hypothetical protein
MCIQTRNVLRHIPCLNAREDKAWKAVGCRLQEVFVDG